MLRRRKSRRIALPPDYAQIAQRYAEQAAAGGPEFCKWTRLAAQRHLDDLERAQADDYSFYFDVEKAARACWFAEQLPIVKGSIRRGENFRLLDWQIWTTACIFGWRRKSDGGRRFKIVYGEVGRKNGKTHLAAIWALYCETEEATDTGELSPEVLFGARTDDQANIVYRAARNISARCPDLKTWYDLEPKAELIRCHANGGFIKRVNSNADSQLGLDPYVVILDEIAVHADRDLHDTMRSSFGARSDYLMIEITTASYDQTSIGFEQHRMVQQILSGALSLDHVWGCIWSLDEGDDPYGETNWKKANPSLGEHLLIENIREMAREAKAGDPDEFLTRQLNTWLTVKNCWLNMDRWRECAGDVNEVSLQGYPCFGGLDLAATSDLNAFVLVWLLEGQLYVRPYLWAPEVAIERRTRRDIPYGRWVSEGLIQIAGQDITDYEFIERDIKHILETHKVREIAYDPWNAYALVTKLEAAGAKMVEFRQGPLSFHPPMKALERLVSSRQIHHGGHPILTWMAGNLVARKDVNENYAPDRKNSHEKIDAMVGLIMALGSALRNQNRDKIFPVDLKRITR